MWPGNACFNLKRAHVDNEFNSLFLPLSTDLHFISFCYIYNIKLYTRPILFSPPITLSFFTLTIPLIYMARVLVTRAISISSSYNVNLVFNVDVLLLCILSLFVLFALPRSVVRFTHLSQWSEGHLLRWVNVRVRSHRVFPLLTDHHISSLQPAHLTSKSPALIPEDPFSDVYQEKGSDDGHSYSSHIHLFRSLSSASQNHLTRNVSSVSTISGRPRRLPTHMASWSTMLPFIAAFFRTPIRPGLSVGKAAIMATYFVIIMYAGLHKSNPFTDPVRAGFVAMSQVPVVVLLATKNNVLGMFIGVGYEQVRYISFKFKSSLLPFAQLNFLHRFAARLFVLAVNVHAIGYCKSQTHKFIHVYPTHHQ